VSQPSERDQLTQLRQLARVWDDLIPLPIVDRRIGLDALIGVVPGIGDVAGALVASWGLVIALRLGAPISVLLRMLLNIGIDATVGAIPLIGDVFDIGWRAQLRNVALLERWMARPEHARRRSAMLLMAVAGGTAAGVVGVVIAALWATVRIVSWVLGGGAP
jgi:hypothetical protein